MIGSSAGQMWAVALNTFRETVRDRVFYLVGLFGALLIGASAVMSPLTIGAQRKIVADVGLAALALFGLLVVVFVGSGMVHKEIDRRTITTILARPVSRRAYVAGKYAGLCLTLLCMLAVMVLLWAGVAKVTATPLPAGSLAAVYLTFLELCLMTAAVVLLSTFASPVLAGIFALALYAIGHCSADLKLFGEIAGGPVLRAGTAAIYYLLPNLEIFNVRGAVVHGQTVSGSYLWWATVYGSGAAALLLLLAAGIFARKELK